MINLTIERQALLLALGAVAMWSTVATVFKLGLAVMSPLQLLFVGTCFSTVVFSIAAWRSGWYLRDLAVGESLAFAAINPIAYYLVLFEAYDRLPAQIAQPLNYTWAITLAILAVPVLGQRLSGRMLAGIGASYLGVLVLLSQGRFEVPSNLDWMGVFLALASTLLWAGYWLFNVRSHTRPVILMANSFLIATPILGVLCWYGPGLPVLSGEGLLYGLWVGLIEMGFTFLLWQRALRVTRHTARIGQLIFLSPFLSLLLIGAVLNERIHVTSWIGLGIIVVGLLITGRPEGQANDEPAGT